MPRKDKDSYNEYMKNYMQSHKQGATKSRAEILERYVDLLEHKELENQKYSPLGISEIEFELKILNWVLNREVKV